ncbi:DUF7518 family protein [Halostella litorea]|uniref:DUF7518 family protein n=1 Tax=Halostella litorea TaxID=2528831 RepID=UPI00109236E2|nr:hypothetical protein [Halostella litorea]
MTGNRVEELEATVAELESTVEGLTEELVEAKERIRVLESELDAETPSRAATPRTTDDGAAEEATPDDVAEAASEAAKADDPQEGDEDADDSDLGDDIIVA